MNRRRPSTRKALRHKGITREDGWKNVAGEEVSMPHKHGLTVETVVNPQRYRNGQCYTRSLIGAA